MDFIQIPTTLLAQVDSSVGGKTAIDLKGGKNLVGAFKQPVCVLCDPDTLRTLPNATFSDGMGEVVKYGMIRDAKLFELLAAHNQETIFSVLEDVICTCISIKRDVVEADEFDTGERMILNYGQATSCGILSAKHRARQKFGLPLFQSSLHGWRNRHEYSSRTTHFEWNGFHSSIQKHDTPDVDLCCSG